jgi:hypothetical protein
MGWAAISLLSRRSCLSAPHLGGDRAQSAGDTQPRGVLGATQAAGDHVVGEFVHDPQLERPPLVGGKRAQRVPRERRQRARLAAVVDALVAVGLDRGLQAEPLSSGGLDTVVLVVLPQQVAGDPEQPRRS